MDKYVKKLKRTRDQIFPEENAPVSCMIKKIYISPFSIWFYKNCPKNVISSGHIVLFTINPFWTLFVIFLPKIHMIWSSFPYIVTESTKRTEKTHKKKFLRKRNNAVRSRVISHNFFNILCFWFFSIIWCIFPFKRLI